MPKKSFKTPKIVSPGRRPVWPWILGLALLAATAWLAYDYGRRNAGYFVEASDRQIDTLEQRIAALEKECDEQRELAARYQRASQIDKAAAQAVQETIKNLEAERAELRQKVAVLNSLISGKVTALEVSKVKLVQKGQSNEYTLEFIVSKRDKGGERVTGQLQLQVVGRQDGKKKVLGDEQLGLDQPFKMGFKHFQRFAGELKLPKGFAPDEIVIKGKPAGKKFKNFEQRLKWSKALG